MSGTPRKNKDWRELKKLVHFIAELEKHGNVTDAMRISKSGRGWIYTWRNDDDDFREAFESARACGREVLIDEAHKRARGWHEPVYRTTKAGKRVKCGDKRHWSDTLLMFLIKQQDPSYREHYQIDHGNVGSRPFLFQMSLHPDALAAQAKQ